MIRSGHLHSPFKKFIEMRIAIGLFLSLVSIIPSIGQNDATGIPFVAYWSIGDRYQFNIEKSQQQWKDGELSKNELSRYTATFHVVDSTATSYTVHWTYDTDVENDYGIPSSIAKRFANYSKMEFQYRTDELGSFVELLNWEDVSVKMKDLFTQMTEVISDGDPATREKIQGNLEPLIPIFSSKEAIEQLVMKEVQLIHYPFGVEFSTTEPFEYDEQLPNLFGGDPIKGRSQVSIASVDREDMRCVLEHRMTIDPKETKKVIMQAMSKMGADDKEMQKEMARARFDISDNNSFDYLYGPGVPVAIVAHRETLITMGKMDGKRIDRTSIELVQ